MRRRSESRGAFLGKVTITYSNGIFYYGMVDGYFRPDKGGRMDFPNGDWFEGPFANGSPSDLGAGRVLLEDGSVYEGPLDQHLKPVALIDPMTEGSQCRMNGRKRLREWTEEANLNRKREYMRQYRRKRQQEASHVEPVKLNQKLELEMCNQSVTNRNQEPGRPDEQPRSIFPISEERSVFAEEAARPDPCQPVGEKADLSPSSDILNVDNLAWEDPLDFGSPLLSSSSLFSDDGNWPFSPFFADDAN